MPARITRRPTDPAYNRDVEREIDESRRMDAFTLSTLPDPVKYIRFQIVVTDAAAPRVAYSDGTDWLRVADDTIVS